MTRHIAVSILLKVIRDKQSLSEALEPFQQHEQKALIAEFCYGVCRYYFSLKAVMNLLLTKKLKAKDIDIELTIILGLYQLKYMQIKDFAAVNETVKLANIFKKDWAKGLINALLRRYMRESDLLNDKLKNNLEYVYAHPYWFIEKLIEQQALVKDICENNNKKASLYLRIDTQKITVEDYLKKLYQQDIEASQSPYLDGAILLASKVNVVELPYFSEGYFFVQDLAAQFATNLLNLSDNQSVLDLCSAPGGKLTGILQSGFKFKEVVSVDNSQKRVVKISENLARLKQSALVIVGDAFNPHQWSQDKTFDRILIDAPCSAMGVIRRHPDIKVLREKSGITEVVLWQKKILQNTWPLLKSGGRLLYVTCSVLAEENQQQIEGFIQSNPDAKVVPFELPIGQQCSVGWQILPGVTDGFYYAILEKI